MTDDFTALPDLASRALGSSVVFATDELFAEKENLILPAPPVFAADHYGNKGKVYDGWETRRRREPGHDAAIVRLGAPGIVRGVVVDTSFFLGNYPPFISVEATSAEGYPSPEELVAGPWEPLVAKAGAAGDEVNRYPVDFDRRWTHVRLSIYPDGGVARFRVHGVVVPDPRFLDGTMDLIALQNGGSVVDCSDAFYSSPVNLILPGRARSMAEGWENARRRDDGNDHVTFRLAAAGTVHHVEIDTAHFVGNAPGWVRVSAKADTADWAELLPRTRVQSDTLHRFLVDGRGPVSHVRLEVYPDGGLSRFRAFGEIEPAALEQLRLRWWNALPEQHRALLGTPHGHAV
jgi:allantoicase